MSVGKLFHRFHRASLAQRIVFWFLLMVLVPTLLLAFITDRLSSESLHKKIHEQLVVIVEAKANRLETYAFERTRAASVLGRLRRLSNATVALQKVGGDVLDKADTENDFRMLADYFMENLGFTNIILLAPQGNVLFQTQELLPLGQNLLTGLQRDSELAKVVKRAMTLLEPDISNFAMYPGVEQPLGFVAAPVINDSGRVVGLLALQLNTQEIFETFGDYTGLGRTGYTVVATLQGDEVRIVAPLRHRPDAAFNLSVRLGDAKGQIVQRAVLGEQGVGELINIEGKSAFAAWTYVPSFRWGIGVQQSPDEALELIYQQRRAMLILLALILLPATLLALFVARSISNPITQAVRAAEQVAAGDLSIRLSSHGDDETGKLLDALGRMVDYLNSLVSQVQRSTIELVATTNTLTAMTRAQGDEATSLGATTSEIAAAAKEISATSEELVNTMTDVTEGAAATTELANAGQAGLSEMEQAMHQLADATHSISDKLGAISEKANNINSVTTTIAKIADQTNLLSLNASIEAEKAGEYGLGFAVLAREIRRLADQTAVATLDIEQMVKEMQGAVTGGVMEMDKFSDRVREGVSETNRISRQFVEIIDQVQDLTPRFESVHEGMRSQSAGARQISDAMISLSDSARASIQALDETGTATRQLETAISDLRREISIFKLS